MPIQSEDIAYSSFCCRRWLPDKTYGLDWVERIKKNGSSEDLPEVVLPYTELCKSESFKAASSFNT
jgi:hypothetical protein